MAAESTSGKPDVIGRAERVDFPDWNLYGIRAKIDTGAYTSSLHCHHIERYTENGRQMVRFNLLDPSHDTYNDRLFELPIRKVKSVKSSNGVSEDRIIVETQIVILGRTLDIQLSLTDRSEMKYPVLIGRRLLRGQFLVDVSRKFISSNQNTK